MEDIIASDLKISESKQSTLCKSYEQLRSQASSFLKLSLQWEDLESHFDSTRKSLQTGLESLSERRKELISREKEMEARESRFDSDFASKKKDLERIEKLIAEGSNEVYSNRKHLDSLSALIQENGEELLTKESEYEAIQKSIAENVKENLALERRIRKNSEEAQLKVKEVESIRKTLRRCKDDLELSERKFKASQSSLEELNKEADLKEERLTVCRSSIEECEKEIKLKEEALNSIKSSIVERSNELESKEKRLELVCKEIESKEKHFVSLKNSVDQCAVLVESKERKIEGLLKELESKEQACESKIEEINLIHNKVIDCLKEVESRENNIEKRFLELQKKENWLKKRECEFELRQRESISSEKSTELRANENTNLPQSQAQIGESEQAQTNNAAIPSTSSNQNLVRIEGKQLQFLLSSHLMKHDSVCSEVFNLLRAASDPAKLVLDAMEGFYPSQSSGDLSEFEMHVVRRSCILLLEQLMEVSPEINPQVKEEAMKLACDWKAKMTATMAKDNNLEVWGLHQLLTSYRLGSAFHVNELRPRGQSSESHQATSSAGKPLAVPKIEQAAEDSLTDIMTRTLNGPVSVVYEISKFLKASPDPPRHVLDFVNSSVSQTWKPGNRGMVLNFMTHCVYLFEELLRISPKIPLLLRDYAMKLAVEWRKSILANSGPPCAIICFLQFLHTFGLFFRFQDVDFDDNLELLEIACEQEDSLEICRSRSFAEEVPDMIMYLTRRAKPIHAARLCCAFNLTEKFQPAQLLINHVKELRDFTTKICKGRRPIEEKEMVADEEIAALEAVKKCVEDYTPMLSIVKMDLILKRIAMLEHGKKQRRHCLAEQERNEYELMQHERHERHMWKKRDREVNLHHGEPYQGRRKFHRTSPLRDRLHCPPPFLPGNFSLGGRNNIDGFNFGVPRHFSEP